MKEQFKTTKELRNAVLNYTNSDIITEYGKIQDWDVSQITDFSLLFDSCHDFNDDISNWDVSNATNMQGMFLCANKFNPQSGSGIGLWDTSNIKTMQSMFFRALEFNPQGDSGLGLWDTSNVYDMAYMFYNARNFNPCEIDLNQWDVSKVGLMQCMFEGVIKFNQELKWNITKVHDINRKTKPSLLGPEIFNNVCTFNSIKTRLNFKIPVTMQTIDNCVCSDTLTDSEFIKLYNILYKRNRQMISSKVQNRLDKYKCLHFK